MNRKLSLFVCASTLLFAPAAAIAADATTNQQAGSDIVVTVQKRPQVLINVPATATAITGATLQQAGVVDMRGVTTLVPSLQLVQTISPVNQSYRIRGMGSEPNIPTFEPDVALFVDGVYMPRSGLGVDDLVSISRIEVLEGPQSTLYGKNATAGVINVITAQPTAHWEGSLEGSASLLDSSINAGVFRLAGTVSGPITDRVRFRLSAVGYSQGDSYKNLQPGVPDANNLHRYALRGQLDADVWDGGELKLMLARTQIFDTRSGDADVMYYTFPPHPNNAFLLDSALGPHFGIGLCPNNNPNDRVICTTSPWSNAAATNLGSAQLTTKVGRNTLTAITAFTQYDVRNQNGDIAQVLLPIIRYDDIQRGGTVSQEVRLTSPGGDKVDWLVGGYYEYSDFTRGDNGHTPTFVLGAAAPFVPLPAPLNAFKVGKVGDEGFLNSEQQGNYGALFGQATWHINDQLALTGGLRGQIEEKRALIDNSYKISPLTPTHAFGPCGALPVNILTALLTGPTTLGCVPINGDFKHQTSYLTWNVTGEYHPTSATMLYATISRGGKSFGYNIGYGNTPASQRLFEDEVVTNYELGVKSKLLGGRARIAASVFYADEDNYQNAGFIGGQFLVNNAKRVTVKGAEANAEMNLGYGFSANAGVTYLDAVYDDYRAGPCYFGEAANNGAGGCILSGRGLPLTPHWRANASLQYTHPVPMGDLYGRADVAWQSEMLADSNLDPRSRQGAYAVANLRIGLKMAHGVDVSAWGTNVFNTTYSQADYVSNLFGPNDPEFQRFLGRPAEYGVTVKKTF